MSSQSTAPVTFILNSVIGLIVMAEAVCFYPGGPNIAELASAQTLKNSFALTFKVDFAPLSLEQRAVLSEGFEWERS
jgi:hypothetical protein